MNKIRQWVGDLSVKKKLIFYGYLIITPVLIIACTVFYFFNYRKVVDERTNSDMESVYSLSDSVDVLQTNVMNFSTYLCINEQIRNLLLEENVEEKNDNARLWLEEAPMQIVQDIVALKGQIQTLAIYPENGIRPYLRCMDGSAYISDTNLVKVTEIYQKTVSTDSGMIWKHIPKGSGDTYYTNRYDKVGLYRRIYDFHRKKVIGYIVIGVNQKMFTKLCENAVKNEKEAAIILDRNGGELCRVGNIDSKLETYLKNDKFVNKKYNEREAHFTYGDYNVSCIQNRADAAIVCKITSVYNFRMLALSAAYLPIILLLGVMISLLPLLIIISNIVTKPLAKVSMAIKDFSKGDFKQQLEVTTNDEVGEVARCFNKMVLDIKDLIEENYVITLKERESELSALQAQINPHFLYNTLDSLYWKATAEDNDEIAECILALSELFKLVLNRGNSEVTVGHEIELISRYLQIQKMRFSKRLDYEIEVSEEALKQKMPKLILQPFVENAIVHGFENVSTKCLLRVTGMLEDGYIRFEVSDTGIGMRQDQIDSIWNGESEMYAKQRIGRYAIKNVKERLELKYNDDFELKIESKVGKGTKVIIRIPII
jgi:two-component system sensor histidine kinase YesM